MQVLGLFTFYWHAEVDRMQSRVLLFDALGLAVFSVSGRRRRWFTGSSR